MEKKELGVIFGAGWNKEWEVVYDRVVRHEGTERVVLAKNVRRIGFAYKKDKKYMIRAQKRRNY